MRLPVTTPRGREGHLCPLAVQSSPCIYRCGDQVAEPFMAYMATRVLRLPTHAIPVCVVVVAHDTTVKTDSATTDKVLAVDQVFRTYVAIALAPWRGAHLAVKGGAPTGHYCTIVVLGFFPV